MSAGDFEERVQCQPLRQVPGGWRQEILSTARQASLLGHVPRTTHYGSPAPPLLSTLRRQLSALLWPHPAAWAGLVAVWLVILGLNHATGEGAPQLARSSSPATPQVFMAFQEQRRVLAELLGPRETPVAERPKVVRPQPRSERRLTLLIT